MPIELWVTAQTPILGSFWVEIVAATWILLAQSLDSEEDQFPLPAFAVVEITSIAHQAGATVKLVRVFLAKKYI